MKTSGNEAMRRTITAVPAMAVLVATIFGFSLTTARAEDPISTVDYACKDGKTIKAAFYSDKVDLVLSDGRKMTLPQTMSGSGIRYANGDESIVFWSKGKGAFITEGADATPTFDGCKG
jgi:membrane-bound inhibitor of C-type lysozyme